MPEHTDVAIIGAGPAGLAVGACLRQAGLNFVILERDHRVASSWHRHYERLHLPSAASETLFPRILDLALGNLSRHGIRRPREGILRRVATSAKIPVIDVGTVRKISEGAIRIEPGISAITADGAIFCGGGVGKFDAIILATGYRPNYRSFLQADDIKNPTDYPPARQNTDSTIYFVGFKNSVNGLLRQISREAVQVAHDIVRRRNEMMRRSRR
jgi:thioredoxin reductase